MTVKKKLKSIGRALTSPLAWPFYLEEKYEKQEEPSELQAFHDDIMKYEVGANCIGAVEGGLLGYVVSNGSIVSTAVGLVGGWVVPAWPFVALAYKGAKERFYKWHEETK